MGRAFSVRVSCAPQITVATVKLPEIERCTELVQCVSARVCVCVWGGVPCSLMVVLC